MCVLSGKVCMCVLCGMVCICVLYGMVCVCAVTIWNVAVEYGVGVHALHEEGVGLWPIAPHFAH